MEAPAKGAHQAKIQDLRADRNITPKGLPRRRLEDIDTRRIRGKGRQNQAPITDQETGRRLALGPADTWMKMSLDDPGARERTVAVDHLPAADFDAGLDLFALRRLSPAFSWRFLSQRRPSGPKSR